MAYLTWGLITLQLALLGYQTYVYKKIEKGTWVKGRRFFSGSGVVVLQFAITAVVIILINLPLFK